MGINRTVVQANNIHCYYHFIYLFFFFQSRWSIDFAILLYVTRGPRKTNTSWTYGVKKKKTLNIARSSAVIYAKRIYENNRETVLFLPIDERSLYYSNVIEMFFFFRHEWKSNFTKSVLRKKNVFPRHGTKLSLHVIWYNVFLKVCIHLDSLNCKTNTTHTILLLTRIKFSISKYLWFTLYIW
jgi:hypothetical protein